MYLKYLQIQSLHIITIMSDDKFSRGSAGSTFVNLVNEIPIIQDVKFVVIVVAEMLEMDL